MIATIAAVAGLLVGTLAGLLVKPSTQRFCPACGVTLSCLSCEEVNSGSPSPSQRT